MPYVNVAKPTGRPYTNVKNGYPLYDDTTVSYDDAGFYYEGDIPGAYTNVAKPIFSGTATLDQSQTSKSDNPFFGTAAFQKMAQSFKPAVTGTLSRIDIDLGKSGSPTDNLQLELYTDGPGTLMATSNVISMTTLLSGFGNSTRCSFTFSSQTFTANTTYWMILSRTGALNESNFPRIFTSADNPDPYTRGAMYYFSGGAWSNYSTVLGGGFFYDFVFREYYLSMGTSPYINLSKPT